MLNGLNIINCICSFIVNHSLSVISKFELFTYILPMVILKFQISGIKCPNTTIRIISAKISGNTKQYLLSKFCLKLFTIIECSRWYKLKTCILSHLFMVLTYAAVLYMYDTLYAILNKSENATLQYSIFCETVLDKKYLLKLDNVFQTSSKRFVETPPICLF